MPLQGSQGLAQRETFKNGEVSTHSSKLSDQFLRIFHFSAWCCLCRISAVMGRRFRQFSPSTKKLQNTPCKKTSSLLKLFSFQHPDFQQILKSVTDVLHFLYLIDFKKTNWFWRQNEQVHLLTTFVCWNVTQAEFLQVNYKFWRKRCFLFGALMQFS